TQQKDRLISVGGNLMSLDLVAKLLVEPGLSVIHTHTLNRLGGIARTVARARRLPLVVTIHGGALDLPEKVRAELARPLSGGIEWGKIFGLLLRSRQLLAEADAIITCNEKEAALAQEKFPAKRILVQPHGVPARLYQQDCRDCARAAFPELHDKKIL